MKNTEETKSFKNLNISDGYESQRMKDFFHRKNYILILIFTIFTLINIIILLFNFYNKIESKIDEKIKIKPNFYNETRKIFIFGYSLLQKEKERPHLMILNKKRTFENRLPLTEEIKCKPHFLDEELIAFLSFLTKDTIFFETGSGCSSMIAKYYTKKSYAVEGCKAWYEKGVKNGLKDNLIFHDLKPDNPIWSYPGKNSSLNDWKNYFQSYDENYNADVILIDGRFKVATAMDIFDKIRDDTIVFLHEYQDRPIYFIIEEYYQYVYHWGSLTAFIKKKGVKSIPLNVQEKYWDNFI